MENTFQNLPLEMCLLEENNKLSDKFDESGDIWALGVILYQLMTNKLPFYG
jgi:serine/threonine protein kinase